LSGLNVKSSKALISLSLLSASYVKILSSLSKKNKSLLLIISLS